MCGRIARTSPRAAIVREFGITHVADVDFSPRYNLAPSQMLEAIIRRDDEIRLGSMRWGLSCGEKRPMPINARAETVQSNPAFRESFARRRCLVIADGFYEWQQREGRKIPHLIRLRSHEPFALAGIWRMHEADGRRIPTCAILTCQPNATMAAIHDRMPVILPREARDLWLDREAGPGNLQDLLVPCLDSLLELYPVSSLVNSPRNDVAECLAPA